MQRARAAMIGVLAATCVAAVASAGPKKGKGNWDHYETGRWESYHHAGETALDRDRLDDAAHMFQSALKDAEQFGRRDPRLVESLLDLAFVHDLQGNSAEADRLYKRAFAALEKGAGKGSPEVARALDGLADRARRRGKNAEAERLYKRAVAAWEKGMGKNDPQLAFILDRYAALLRETGRTSEAEKLEKRAASIRERRKN